MTKIDFATRDIRMASPRFPKSWGIRKVALNTLLEKPEMAPITIVDQQSSERLSSNLQLTRALADRFKESPRSNFLVLCIKHHGTVRRDKKFKLLKRFPHPERIEFVENMQAIEEVLENLSVKVQVLQERERSRKDAPPRQAPLDNVRQVLSATEDLRLPNGKLSAEHIAKTFGITLSQFAKWLGRTRQAVTKTPDADSLQDQLSYFERIARLRIVISDEEFRKWLRMPNPTLEQKAPLDIISERHWQILVDLVDDMLTGAPT